MQKLDVLGLEGDLPTLSGSLPGSYRGCIRFHFFVISFAGRIVCSGDLDAALRALGAGSAFTKGRASRPRALHSEGLPSCDDIDPRWSASRILGGEDCGVMDYSKMSEFIFCRRQAIATAFGSLGSVLAQTKADVFAYLSFSHETLKWLPQHNLVYDR